MDSCPHGTCLDCVSNLARPDFYISLMWQMEASVLAAQIKPCLTEMSDDPDRDVRFFSKKAIKTCDDLCRA